MRALLIVISTTLLSTLVHAQRWSSIAASGPAPRVRGGFVFDTARGVAVLFGGSGQNSRLNDTWEWDGSNWTQRFPRTVPPARVYHSMVYDSRRGVVVMFGGSSDSGSGLLNDTWEWDGVDWTQRPTQVRPPGRMAHQMGYSASLGTTVLFGGITSLASPLPPPLGDTWTYDGFAWTRRIPQTYPPARSQHVMAVDPTNDRVAMFGGFIGSIQVTVPDHWEWDGNDWNLINPNIPPGGELLGGTALIQDESFVLEAGDVFQASTWILSDGSWIRDPGTPPATVYHGAYTYDPVRNRAIKFGGQSLPLFLTSQLWEYDPSGRARFRTFGSGCAGSLGVPVLGAQQRPVLSTMFDIELSNIPPSGAAWIAIGFSASSVAGFPLPIDLTSIGANGCSLLTSAETAFGYSNTGGTTTLSLPVPANTSLIGTPFYAQGFAAEAGANPLGLLVSNGGEGLLGSF